LPGFQRLGGRVIDGATIFRESVFRVVTNTELSCRVTSPLPGAIIILLVGNTTVSIFQLSSLVIHSAAFRGPIMILIITHAKHPPLNVGLTNTSVVASISLSKNTRDRRFHRGLRRRLARRFTSWLARWLTRRLFSGLARRLSRRFTS
jgi:hypothetical protein